MRTTHDYYLQNSEAYVNIRQLEEMISYIKEDISIIERTKEKSTYEEFLNGIRNLIEISKEYITNLVNIHNEIASNNIDVTEMDDREYIKHVRELYMANMLKSDLDSYVKELDHFQTLLGLYEEKAKLLF